MFSDRRTVLAGLLVCLALPVPARAAPDPRAAAETLFAEGRAAMDRGDFAKACPLLARSQELDPAGGTLLNLALCHEKAGRLVSALADWKLAAERAHADRRIDREREALVHVADLEGRIPHVTFTVRDHIAGLVASIDGVAIAMPTPSTPVTLRLDPGNHVLRSEIAGHRPLVRTFDLHEKQATTMPIDAQPDGLEPGPSEPAQPVVPEEPLVMAAGPAPRPPSPETRLTVPSKVLLGSAAAFGVVAIVTGVLAVSARVSYTGTCLDSRGYCTDSDAIASGDRARSLAWVSTAAAGVGLAALWTGLLLPRRVVLVPAASARSAELALRVTY